jgi:hypothetical protein
MKIAIANGREMKNRKIKSRVKLRQVTQLSMPSVGSSNHFIEPNCNILLLSFL